LAEDQVYISQPVEPRDIPYRALLPEFGECHILRVPVCISASTIAFTQLLTGAFSLLGFEAY
jgi:hypothetical protein